MATDSIVCLFVILTVFGVCLHTVDCNKENEERSEYSRDVPLIAVQAIRKTGDRIEVEIISSVLIDTEWYSDMFVRADESSYMFGSLQPMRDESRVSVWEHTRLEGESAFITTAGIANLDSEVIKRFRHAELRISASQGNVGFGLTLPWGFEEVDVSSLPVLQSAPPSVILFEEGEEVRATVVATGNDLDVTWGYTVVKKDTPTRHLMLYATEEFGGIDRKEGVKASSKEENNLSGQKNTTEAVLEIKDTSLESNWGFYQCSISLHPSVYIYITLSVLPKSKMSIAPDGEVWLSAFSSMGMWEEPIIGIRYGHPAFIRCLAVGFPVDDVTIIRPSSESASMETRLSGGYGTADLYLESAKESDEGTYTCVASSFNRIFKLDVVVMHTERSEIKFEEISQTQNQIVLRCSARGYPVPTLTFERMDPESYEQIVIQDGGIYDIHVDVDDEDNTVTATLKVSEGAGDYGDSYTCIAENIAGLESAWLDVFPHSH